MEDPWRGRKEQVAACLERSLDALLESWQRYRGTLAEADTATEADTADSWGPPRLRYFFRST
jgi:hypothetical protein